MLPVAGSAYTFSYATFGEFLAWTIGWNLRAGAGDRRRRRRQRLVELSANGIRISQRHSQFRLVDAGLGRAADRRAGGDLARIGHQVVVAVLHGGHRGQGGGGGAGDRRRRLLRQDRELLAVHPAARDRSVRLRHQPVAAVAAHRCAQQPLRLVRGAGGRVDRVLRVHRIRHRGHHGRGDQEPAARCPPGHPGDAGHRDRALRGGVCRAVRDGPLHRC